MESGKSYMELMKKRKSVRTFDGRPLTAEDREKLAAAIAGIGNPFGIPVEFRILDAAEYGLTSPVIVGAHAYLAAKAKRQPDFELACGYAFERACLEALALGIGTVMLAASLNRPAFERALEVGGDEVMPVASPIGYPAEKRSVRETLMRKGIRADTRLPFGEIFFDGSFGKPLDQEKAGALAPVLDCVRWSPSAANRQPCRAVIDGDRVHFYEAKSMKDSPLGDIQRFDCGIAMAHFELASMEQGRTGSFVRADPGIPLPEGVLYAASWQPGNA
ncbi:MAG: nitroreductase [Clostridia bacterium]|nr:nitroreductase [Clostridia bacterium]MBQ4350272.1 nitroreductase [Clostridia bacterium]